MTASTLEPKARRLLGGGVGGVGGAVGEDRIEARVRSDHSGIVDVHWSRFDGWHCTCPAYGRCSHVEAVVNVTMRSPRRSVSPVHSPAEPPSPRAHMPLAYPGRPSA